MGFWEDVTAMPIIGGVARGVGSILGLNADQKQANDQMDLARVNLAQQREFAQNSIRWRVEDAKAAGIHPLAALGSPGASFSPISAGSSDLGSSFRSIGQDVGRAIEATSTASERRYTESMRELDLRKAKALTELAEYQATSASRAINPPIPNVGETNFIPGQGDSGTKKGGLVKNNPLSRTVSQPGRPAQDAGWVPDVAYARTDTGLVPIPSKDVKERIEDQFIPETIWAIRNYGGANLGYGAPPANMLPKGAVDWEWNYKKQEWQPIYKTPSWVGRGVWRR